MHAARRLSPTLALVPLAALVLSALVLSAARPAVAQQPLTLTFTAAPQSSVVTTAYGDVTLTAAAANTTVTLTAGVPQTVGLGSIDAAYSGAGFPNGTSVPFSFSFTRAMTATGTPSAINFAFPELMAGSGFAQRGGSVGQYAAYNFTLSAQTATYDYGPYGTVQAQWQSASAFSTGLSSTPAPVAAILTLVAAPEPSQTAALALGALGLSALTLRARKRTAA